MRCGHPIRPTRYPTRHRSPHGTGPHETDLHGIDRRGRRAVYDSAGEMTHLETSTGIMSLSASFCVLLCARGCGGGGGGGRNLLRVPAQAARDAGRAARSALAWRSLPPGQASQPNRSRRAAWAAPTAYPRRSLTPCMRASATQLQRVATRRSSSRQNNRFAARRRTQSNASTAAQGKAQAGPSSARCTAHVTRWRPLPRARFLPCVLVCVRSLRGPVATVSMCYAEQCGPMRAAACADLTNRHLSRRPFQGVTVPVQLWQG